MLNFENLNKLQTTFFGEDHFFIYLIALTIWRLVFYTIHENTIDWFIKFSWNNFNYCI